MHEGVAWLQEDSPVVMVNVAAQGGTVELCPGVMVDISGGTGVASAVQQCVNATAPGGTLLLPAGVYLMDAQLVLANAITLQTSGLAGNGATCLQGASCAVLRAAAGLNVSGGIVRLTSAAGVILDHLVVDGNRAARLGSAAATQCAAGANTYGFNALADNCAGCSFTHSASVQALCGSGFVWVGDNATVTHSFIANNGDHNTTNMWADGLTLLRSASAVVEDNRFEDNSDVDLILGGSTNASVRRNTVVHAGQPSFAGLMLDNFNASTPGDFTGTTVEANSIQCANHLCDFGVEVGPSPWYASANILGGTVTGNTVINAKQGINVAGAGTAASPLVLFGNTASGAGASATFLCGTHQTSNLNIAPGSVVDRMGDTTPATSFAWMDCP